MNTPKNTSNLFDAPSVFRMNNSNQNEVDHGKRHCKMTNVLCSMHQTSSDLIMLSNTYFNRSKYILNWSTVFPKCLPQIQTVFAVNIVWQIDTYFGSHWIFSIMSVCWLFSFSLFSFLHSISQKEQNAHLVCDNYQKF